MKEKTLLILVSALIVAVIILGIAASESKLRELGSLSSSPVSNSQTVTPANVIPRWNTSFEYPYPISWQDGNINLAIMGISVGSTTIPANPYPQRPQNNINYYITGPSGEKYTIGEEVYAVVFSLKISSGGSNFSLQQYFQIPLNVRRRLKDGGYVAPNNTQLGTGSMMPNDTLLDQKVLFIVPHDETSFEFTTGGLSKIFFTVTPKSDNTIELAKEAPPEQAIPTSTDTYTNTKTSYTPLTISIISPSSSLSIARGTTTTINWAVLSGTTRYEYVYFYLKQGSQVVETKYFNASNQSGAFGMTAPPGDYVLSSPSDPSNTQIPIHITGSTPQPSPQHSTLVFYGYDEIPGDGICKTVVNALIHDEYGYGIQGVKVSLASNRPTSDTILPQAVATDDTGAMAFSVLSNSPGNSILTATVNNVTIGKSVLLTVDDPKTSTCQKSYNYPSDYYGDGGL